MDDDAVLDGLFQNALTAIDAGDLPALEALLAAHPQIARERLTEPGEWLRAQIGPALQSFYKDPYLLWFLTEDAVRTGVLPANVGAMARAIIETAKRQGATNLQDQLDSALHFAICSPIGREDGSQRELLDVLIDAGASMEGGPVQALICYNFAAARHLIARGATLTLPAALCLEMWDAVPSLARDASTEDKQIALGLAALNGKAEGLRRLLPLGVDLDAFTSGFYSHATPLHHAVWSGSLDAVKVLVEAGAALDTHDKAEDATPLGWAEYALTGPESSTRGKQFSEIVEYLRAKERG